MGTGREARAVPRRAGSRAENSSAEKNRAEREPRQRRTPGRVTGWAPGLRAQGRGRSPRGLAAGQAEINSPGASSSSRPKRQAAGQHGLPRALLGAPPPSVFPPQSLILEDGLLFHYLSPRVSLEVSLEIPVHNVICHGGLTSGRPHRFGLSGRRPKRLLTFFLNGALTPQVTHRGRAAGRAGGSGQGVGDSSLAPWREWRCVPAPCNAFPP